MPSPPKSPANSPISWPSLAEEPLLLTHRKAQVEVTWAFLLWWCGVPCYLLVSESTYSWFSEIHFATIGS